MDLDAERILRTKQEQANKCNMAYSGMSRKEMTMPRIRGLPKKYKISETRFRELYYFCLQYNDWIKSRERYPKESREYQEYTDKIHMVETACEAACEDLAPYIKEAVTKRGVTYQTLQARMNIPCSGNTYYKYRRKFYWIMDSLKE